jgi:hypothetical protein
LADPVRLDEGHRHGRFVGAVAVMVKRLLGKPPPFHEDVVQLVMTSADRL